MSPLFFSLGFFEIVIIVFGIIGIVWFANRVSRSSNQKGPDTPQQNSQPSQNPSPKPIPHPEVMHPKKSRSLGCLFALFGAGLVGLLLVVGVIGLFGVRYTVAKDQARRSQAIAQQIEIGEKFRSSQLEGQAEAQRQAIEQFEQIQSQLTPDLPTGISVEVSPQTGPSVHVQTRPRIMSLSFIGLFLILLFVLLPITVLVVITIILIANRASRQKGPTNGYDSSSGSDSMAYQASSRPVRQKMGFMPLIVVGMACVVGLIVVAFGLFFVAQPVDVRSSETAQIAEFKLPQHTNPDHIEVELVSDSKPEPIDVPVEKPIGQPKETPIVPTSDHATDQLDAELDGSAASLLLESVLRAAMKSFQEDTAKTVAAEADDTVIGDTDTETKSDKTATEASKTEKPISAVRSLTRALVTELPDGIDESTALKSLGRFLGRAIATESVTRPPWVDQPSGVDLQTGKYRAVVTVGPYQTRMDCDRRRDAELRKTVDDYTEICLGPVARGRANLSTEQLNELINRTYQESINTSVGPMVNVHTELVFDNTTRALLEARFRESLVQERIQWSSIALGCVSLFLLGAFAVLKLDPLYRRRIAIAVGVSVVILLGLGILVIA